MSAVTNPVPVAPSPVIIPPLPLQPKPRSIWKWVVLAVVIAGGLYALYRWESKPVPDAAAGPAAIKTAKVTTGRIERTNRIAGQSGAVNFNSIIAPSLRGPEGGREMVLLYLVKNGSTVKKGQVVAEIDGQSMKDHVDDLGDTIAAADADIRKREAEQGVEWETLQQTLRVAKSEFDKWKLDYAASEVKTDVERQLMKLSLDEAEARHKQLQGDLPAKRAAHQAELGILKYTRERHVRHRDRHQTDLKRFTIVASMDGLAVILPTFRGGEMGQIQQGDQIRPGQGFMKIVSTAKMHLEGTINQSESSDFRIGQKARIFLDAFPEMEMSGKVHSIGALATGGWRQGYYIRTVPIRIMIEGSDPKLIPDLSASAEVTLEAKDGATTVPLTALRSENGKTVAYVKTAEGFEARPVQTGIRNETHAAILSGLTAGEEVRVTW